MVSNKQLIITVVAASSATAIAFFSYKVYKEYKRQTTVVISQVDVEDEILRERVVDELAKRREEKKVKSDTLKEVWVELAEKDDIEEEAQWARDYYEKEEDIDPEEYYDEEDEEVEKLRYDPNSQEALTQYKNMRLAEMDKHGNDTRATLERLFEEPILPTNDEDGWIIDHIIEKRREFFGDNSIWNDNSSVAELILHFAIQADFDCDGGVAHWCNSFVSNMGLWSGIGKNMMDEKLTSLFKHTLDGNMFGLMENEWLEVHNRSRKPFITFTNEYHFWLELCGEIDEDDDLEELGEYEL
ncbi:MAG: hypothetical protein RR643_04870 [Anaerorhabdus sp.]|uniref:hypothetical protein n=1 Tax=Anaerorhabdus sp. TaxID=1872524 RepID=UPI002FC635E1